MPHATIDDQFPDHPKIASLSDAAFRLHVAGIVYCSRHMTDGLVDGQEVPRLLRTFKRKALAELVDRGLWIAVMGGAAYSIHDYLQWNDSRDMVMARRAHAAERKRKWRADNGR